MKSYQGLPLWHQDSSGPVTGPHRLGRAGASAGVLGAGSGEQTRRLISECLAKPVPLALELGVNPGVLLLGHEGMEETERRGWHHAM